ncbi:MAG: L-serine ammonia-lyase [Bacteroidales bacterium]|nr:L-serine ammonia-lyase [Bacteroidales bacterium]MBN2817690.1 L-serine ammonia-lyase [Bacteroidales bacterium]
MESIKEIYKIGHGPSSSHTMGPRKAALQFLKKNENAASYKVTLFGSLAATAKGHLTHKVLHELFNSRELEIIEKPTEFLPRHPNAMKFEAINKKGETNDSWTAYSVGGGSVIDDNTNTESKQVYPLNTMDEILEWCYDNGKPLWGYVEEYEKPEIWDYLAEVWKVMQNSIRRGLDNDETLPGELHLPRKAGDVMAKAENLKGYIRKRSMLYAYALAVSEENAGGGLIATSPTCGGSGVVPAVLYYYKNIYKGSHKKVLRALATAGLVGNLVKANASISGAEVGCQGEVGTACAMGSAALTQISGGSIYQVEYAAEMGLEHHLGLTCDPVLGLVQIPCIERNAMAAARALNHKDYAMLSDGRHFISFDQVVQTMNQTGRDLPSLYRETSTGGLAMFYRLNRRGTKK